MFEAAKLSRDLSVTTSRFECSIWILIHTASYNRKKKQKFWWYRFAFYCMDINVLSQMKGAHTFSGWRSVQSFRRWTQPSLANLEGQLHAQDRLEGGENRFSCVKDAQTVRHWEPWVWDTRDVLKVYWLMVTVTPQEWKRSKRPNAAL